jgi:DNA invertase Pin-like site-specific DNA recombinase
VTKTPTVKGSKEKQGDRIGYARVSKREQNLDLQLDALDKANCFQIYQEKISSRKANRPELEHALKALREGDTLVIWKLDRLGRSLTELIRIIEDLKERKVFLESISDKVDTETAMGKMFFQFMGMMAEYERNVIQERTIDGLTAARARGRRGGRKPKLFLKDYKEIAVLLENSDGTVGDIAKRYGVSRQTLYKNIDMTTYKVIPKSQKVL